MEVWVVWYGATCQQVHSVLPEVVNQFVLLSNYVVKLIMPYIFTYYYFVLQFLAVFIWIFEVFGSTHS